MSSFHPNNFMKIVVYGLGKEYECLKDLLEKEYEIVALSDKEAKKIEGYVAPNELKGLDYDAIFITTTKYRKEIEKDIIEILSDRSIKFLSKEELFGKFINPFKRDQWVINELLNLPKGWRILDAGAGEMRYSKYCKHLEYHAQDFGKYDPSESKVGLQSDKWEYSEEIVKCDITDMPFVDGEFDAVLCTEVFEHLKNPVKALEEFRRIIRKGGKLILTAPFSCLTHMAPYFYSSGFSEFWYRDNLKDNGFEIEKIVKYGDYYSWIKQEVFRIPQIAEKYNKYVFDSEDEALINRFAYLLTKLEGNGNMSDEVLCFGHMVVANKCR